MLGHRPTRALALALFTLLLPTACADTDPTQAEEDESAPPVELAAEQVIPSLRGGKREVLVQGIKAVENSFFTSTGRLVVSGDEGLYELAREPSGALTARALHGRAPCKFSGVAQLGSHVYAGCYDSARSFLFAAPEATLEFAQVAEIKGVKLANGVASDGVDHLYVSATTQGKIVRLTIAPSAPTTVATQEVWRSNTGGLLPNGLDIHDGNVYWGDVGSLRRAPLARAGASASLLVSQLTFFDDLHVDAGRILVTDYLGGSLRSFDLSGKRLSETGSVFKSPSSVLPALGRLGFGERDLIVTEKGASLVSVYHPQ